MIFFNRTTKILMVKILHNMSLGKGKKNYTPTGGLPLIHVRLCEHLSPAREACEPVIYPTHSPSIIAQRFTTQRFMLFVFHGLIIIND